jgi:hypothetical protein
MLRQIRLHADTINGTLGANYYLNVSQWSAEESAAQSGYIFLGEDVPVALWPSEMPIAGLEDVEYGYKYRDKIVCDVTVLRQQSLGNIYRLLKASPAQTDRFVFVEIGAGYGAFALDMMRMIGNAAYVVVDLPETLIFSACYLATHLKNVRIYVYVPGEDPATWLANTAAYDLALIPNYRAEAIAGLPYVDIAYNSVSFPEMGPTNARSYLQMIAPRLRRFMMSVNDRHFRQGRGTPTSPSVDDVLAEQFTLFPKPSEYDQQLGLTDADHFDMNFRPTLIGTTDRCLPVAGAEIRCATLNFGHVLVRGASLRSAATISKVPRKGQTVESTGVSSIRRFIRRLTGTAG